MVNLPDIELRSDGLYWPSYDKHCYEWTGVEMHACDVISTACEHRRRMVSAGANVGAYALKYASMFDTVYAFEPDNTNFKCLLLNTLDTPNVIKMQMALGAAPTQICLSNDTATNCGTLAVSGTGSIPLITLDSLELVHVDLIHLDTEGYEFFALTGARETIKRCRPAIAFEWVGHNERHGISEAQILEFLENLDYVPLGKVSSDVVFIHKENHERKGK